MSLKVCAFVIMILAITCGASYSETSFQLFQTDQNDVVIVSSRDETVKIPIKARIGTVKWGLLSDHKFYSIDITYHEILLLMTDLKLMKTEVLLDFKKKIDVRYLPVGVHYVDNDKMIIETITFDKKPTSCLFQYDRQTNELKELIINYDGGPISVYGPRMYYTGKDGEIYCRDGWSEKSLQIKGKSPTISHDGKRLAYISSGLIRNSIRIYDLENRKTKSIISFFNSIDPIIRWSSDSSLIALQTTNDLYAPPLYVVDSSTGDVVHEYEKSYAHNWFFIDEAW